MVDIMANPNVFFTVLDINNTFNDPDGKINPCLVDVSAANIRVFTLEDIAYLNPKTYTNILDFSMEVSSVTNFDYTSITYAMFTSGDVDLTEELLKPIFNVTRLSLIQFANEYPAQTLARHKASIDYFIGHTIYRVTNRTGAVRPAIPLVP
jgi:hypothetical protein